MPRDTYKKYLAPFLVALLKGSLSILAVLCRALPRSWMWRVILGLSKLLTTIKRPIPYSYTAAPAQNVEPVILSLVLDSFSKYARPFQFPYHASGGGLLRDLHREHGGVILCGSHAFLLNRLVHNLVNDLGHSSIRIMEPGNTRRLGRNLWGRGSLLQNTPIALGFLVGVARCLREGAVVVVLCDWGKAKVCPKIFEFAALIRVPVLFFATGIAHDDMPEIIIESSPQTIMTTKAEISSCIEAYRSFVARYAGVNLEIKPHPGRYGIQDVRV